MNFPGVIGTGSNALNWYLSRLNELGTEKYGYDYVLPLKVLKTEFRPINNELPYNIKKASSLLEPYFREMEEMTDAPYILANITLHEAVNRFSSAPSSQFINLEKICSNTSLAGNQTVMILGSSFTMQHEYLPNLLRGCNQNIKVVKPSKEWIENFDQLRKVYYLGGNPTHSREVFTSLFRLNPHIDTFIIACTELSIALEDSSIKQVFDQRIFNLPVEQCKLLLNRASNLHD